MKRLLFLFTAITLFVTVAQAQPDIKFSSNTIDIGTIKANSMTTKEVSFYNIGNEALILSNVSSYSKFLVVNYSNESIQYGQLGKIKLSINSIGLQGAFQSKISITSNAKSGVVVITIKGKVEQ